jgi:hypothetical protein
VCGRDAGQNALYLLCESIVSGPLRHPTNGRSRYAPLVRFARLKRLPSDTVGGGNVSLGVSSLEKE